jgi:hypothetical protein
MHPPIHYARSGDLKIAYQVTGDGPIDPVWTPGTVSQLDMEWTGRPEPACSKASARSAARISAFAEADEVLVSSTVRDLVAGSGIKFEDRGAHEFKGIDEARRVYRVGNV